MGVQNIRSPLAGAWLLFHLLGCAVLLYNAKVHFRNPLWYLLLTWLLVLSISTFLLNPVAGGGFYFWVLLAMPSLALCLSKENLRPYLICFGAIITLYALGLIAQKILDVKYTSFDYYGRMAWPLLDPNNAAAVVNVGLIPCFHAAIKKKKLGWLLPIFLGALYSAGSRTGYAVGLGACLFIALRSSGVLTFLVGLLAGLAWTFVEAPMFLIDNTASLFVRASMLSTSLPLALVNPVRGIGLGQFTNYYKEVRTEQNTIGWHCHNDILQVAIELGIPAAIIFASLFLATWLTTGKENFISGCVIAALLVHSMLEFQFYTPSISLIAGLAFAYHILNSDRALLRKVGDDSIIQAC